MQRPRLKVEERKVLGKKVKKLRREGILPANIYGKDIKSQAVQLPSKEFEAIFKEVGETGLIDLEVNGQKKPVLIKNPHRDPLTDLYLHTDFYQVNLKEKIKTMVPVVTIGEPKTVSEKIGLLLQSLAEVEVEALPEDLPENIEINVEPLASVDEQITVKELKAPKGVEILTDPEQVIVKISELVSKEAAEQAAAEAAAKEAAKAETAAVETAKAEGVTEAGAETPTEKAAPAEEQPASRQGEKPQEAPKTEEKAE